MAKGARSKWYDGLVPRSDDEDDITEDLYGRNEATGVILNGWTNNTYKGLIGAKEALAVRKWPLKELVEKFEYFKWSMSDKRYVRESTEKFAMSLKDLHCQAKFGPFTLSEPVFVQVVEKTGVFHIPKNGKSLLMATLLVADDSGIGLVSGMNDMIANVYDRLEISDYLVLNAGRVGLAKVDEYPVVTSLLESKLVPVEIKIRTYDCRKVFPVEATGRCPVSPSLYPEKGTYLPYDLWNPAINSYELPENVKCINIAGVVSYVGCIFRTMSKENVTSVALADGSTRKHYNCFRWIQLVDSDVKKPISVKIYLNNLNWDRQKNIVPGSVVVISNVVANEDDKKFLTFYLGCTPYTRVYVNRDITHGYLGAIPKSNREIIKKLVSPNATVNILSPRDIRWAVGGQLLQQVSDVAGLFEVFEDAVSDVKKARFIRHKEELVRREEHTCMVRGYLYRIDKLSSNETKLYWMSKMLPTKKYYSRENDSKEWNFRNTVTPDFKKYWYAFQKEFPAPNCDHAEVLCTYESNTTKFSGACGPLLLPATYTDDQPHLNELPIVGGESCYILWIAHPLQKVIYSAIWRGQSPEDMEWKIRCLIEGDENRKVKVRNPQAVDVVGVEEDATETNGKSGPASKKPRKVLASLQVDEEEQEKDKAQQLFILNFFKIEQDKEDPNANVVIQVVDIANVP